MHVSPEVRYELSFWFNNIDSINGKVMSPKSSALGVVYSECQVFDPTMKCRLALLSERFWQLNLFCSLW